MVTLFTSCSFQNERTLPLDLRHKQTIEQKKVAISKTGFRSSYGTIDKNLKKRVVDLKGSGYIKGVVTKIVPDRHGYIYYIKGLDTSNGKLSFAKAYGKRHLCKKGDLVYAVINNANITSLYLYKSAKSFKLKVNKINKKRNKIKQKSKQLKKSSKSPKTRQRVQVIDAPVPEKILF